MINKKRVFISLIALSTVLSGCQLNLGFIKIGGKDDAEQSEKQDGHDSDVKPGEDEDPGEGESKEYLINPVSPKDEEAVSLGNDDLTDFVKNYTFGYSSNHIEEYDHYDSKQSLTLSWNVKEQANYFVIEFCENKEMEGARRYLTNATTIDVDDVYPGMNYYWRVNAYYESKIIRSYVFSLSTLSMPTTLYLESVKNLRDLGGLLTEDNKRIKNGQVFRGANADGAIESEKQFMLNDLKIKTEIELRNKNEGARNKLGVENFVEIDDNGGFFYNNIPNGISYETGRQVLLKELKHFANKDNYPIYFHCAIGRDRTGSLALVLLSLLGVSKKDIFMDYELSMFALVSNSEIRGGTVSVVDLLNQLAFVYNYIYSGYPGSTMKERTENFLLEIGMTQEEINTIRSCMLEDR